MNLDSIRQRKFGMKESPSWNQVYCTFLIEKCRLTVRPYLCWYIMLSEINKYFMKNYLKFLRIVKLKLVKGVSVFSMHETSALQECKCFVPRFCSKSENQFKRFIWLLLFSILKCNCSTCIQMFCIQFSFNLVDFSTHLKTSIIYNILKFLQLYS